MLLLGQNRNSEWYSITDSLRSGDRVPKMKYIPEIPLSIIGKDSFLPFAGMFFAKHYTSQGWSHVVGRFYEADVKKDFVAIRKFEQRLRTVLKDEENEAPKRQLETLWNVAKEEKLFSNSIATMVSLIGGHQKVGLGGFGLSGLWGNTEEELHTWYPLLPQEHPLFEPSTIPEEEPSCLIFSTYPHQILVRPKPSRDGLGGNQSIGKRIFEVSR